MTTTTGTTGNLMLSTSCTVLGGDENRLKFGFSWILRTLKWSTIIQTSKPPKNQNQVCSNLDRGDGGLGKANPQLSTSPSELTSVLP